MENQEAATRSADCNDGVVNKPNPSPLKFPLTFWEMAAASGVVLSFVLGLIGVYLTMPESDYSFLKLPRSLEDLQILRYIPIIRIYTYFYYFFFLFACFVRRSKICSDFVISVFVML